MKSAAKTSIGNLETLASHATEVKMIKHYSKERPCCKSVKGCFFSNHIIPFVRSHPSLVAKILLQIAEARAIRIKGIKIRTKDIRVTTNPIMA